MKEPYVFEPIEANRIRLNFFGTQDQKDLRRRLCEAFDLPETDEHGWEWLNTGLRWALAKKEGTVIEVQGCSALPADLRALCVPLKTIFYSVQDALPNIRIQWLDDLRPEYSEEECGFKPIEENPIRLELEGMDTLYTLHRYLKKKFGLPEYYGENWDALYDCLSYLFARDGEIRIAIRGYHTMNDEMQKRCLPMLGIFDQIHEETPNVKIQYIS